ncbi:hypothetical protein HY029_01265, partial [Candidatus Gottesmanbacteria bacterium]|nr:hypothetical protein [Candidatus Gottesmanbacteria bacterium]
MTLRRWVADGKITCLRTQGNFRRFTYDELERVKKYGPLSNSPLLSAKQASHELGVSKQTIKRWGKKGKINIIKDATHHLYLPKEKLGDTAEPRFWDFTHSDIWPHQSIHIAAIGLSVLIFCLIFFTRLNDLRVSNLGYSLPRPITGAISTIASTFSPKLATTVSIYMKPANVVFAQSDKPQTSISIPSIQLPGKVETIVQGSGKDGSTGAEGPKGAPGEIGPAGSTGAAGAKGDKGDKGDKGNQGDAGPGGATGATGANG